MADLNITHTSLSGFNAFEKVIVMFFAEVHPLVSAAEFSAKDIRIRSFYPPAIHEDPSVFAFEAYAVVFPG